MHCRKVIVTGGVGVGKSSILEAAQKELTNLGIKHHIVPEYIDVLPDAVERLGKYLRCEESSYSFQQYVINYYDYYFSNTDFGDAEVLLFERGTDDPVVCFANMDNAKGRLKDNEFEEIRQLGIKISKKWNMPSYYSSDDSSVFIPMKTINAELDGKLVAHIVNSRPGVNIVIGLYNDDETCYQRMIKRNRPGEADVYTRGYITQFNNIYNKLYKSLMSPGYIDKNLSKYL